MHLNLVSIIETFGYLGLFAIIFAESGLLIGFFLPGDSVLFTAGFLASQNVLSLPILIVTCFVAAVTGDSVGYTFGHRIGKRLFQREDSVFFHKKNITKAQEFYKKYGAKTIVLARFTPVIRTFAPIVAGVGDMEYRTFVSYNIIGGLLWATGLNVAGYFLGRAIPNVDRYLLPIVLLIIIASIAPSAYHILKDPESRAELLRLGRKAVKKIGLG